MKCWGAKWWSVSPVLRVRCRYNSQVTWSNPPSPTSTPFGWLKNPPIGVPFDRRLPAILISVRRAALFAVYVYRKILTKMSVSITVALIKHCYDTRKRTPTVKEIPSIVYALPQIDITWIYVLRPRGKNVGTHNSVPTGENKFDFPKGGKSFRIWVARGAWRLWNAAPAISGLWGA